MAAGDLPTQLPPSQAPNRAPLPSSVSEALTLPPPTPASAPTGGSTPLNGRTVSHFRLVRRLGSGAVGEVYLAHDTALGRDVALKLLRPGLPHEWRRLLVDESAAAARLQHPAIATFYESGESAGISFIATEYVRGQTLRERLGAGPLALRQAIAVTEALLAALAHAHAVGVMHRDVKPENIMLAEDGGLRLLDFGLAVGLDLIGGFADLQSRLTSGQKVPLAAAGVVAGTPGYMPPEQIRGERLDARADLFAAGAVLYELLSGEPAFAGADPHQRWKATLERAPGALIGPRFAHLPAGLWQIVERALAKDVAERPSSAGALLAQLLRVSESDGTSRGSVLETASSIDRPTQEVIAVCPWRNIAGRAEDDWIASAIAESLAAALAEHRRVKLVGDSDAAGARIDLAPPDPDGEALQLGLVTGSRYVLTGGFQKLGSRLRLTARLLQTPTGQVLTAVKVDGSSDELFDLQDQLAVRVASALPQSPALLEDDGEPRRTAPSPSVYECFARGHALRYRMGKANFQEAQLLFEQAVAKDPGFSPALAELAAIHGMGYIFTTDRSRLRSAVEYARRAIAADPRGAPAYSWLGYALWRLGSDEEAFEAERRASELDPHDYQPLYFGGCISASRCNWELAISLLQRSVRLKRSYPWAWGVLGISHLRAGNTEEAMWCIQQSIEHSREGSMLTLYPVGPALLGEMHRLHGNPVEGRRLALEALAAIEATDHAYRDGFRATALTVIGRCALDQNDPAAAHVAFSQAISQLRARPHVLGGGHLVVQSLAGLSRAADDPAFLEEARRLAAEGRRHASADGFDFAWAFLSAWDVTDAQIAAAGEAHPRMTRAPDGEADASRVSDGGA